MDSLTADDRERVRLQASLAEGFLSSDLFNLFKDWIKGEQEKTTRAIVTDEREAHEKALSREQFVERKCAYYIALPMSVGFFKALADKGVELQKLEKLEAEAKEEQNG